MKLPSRVLLLSSITARHISRRQSSSSSSSSSPSTTSQSAFVNEVVAILNTISPIESALEPLVPFLSPDIIPSIIKETQNPQVGFRFYIWATKRKRLLSWVSRNLVVDMLLEPNGFDLYWTTLEELKEAGVPVTSNAFHVLISGYAKAGACEKVLESFGKMKEFDCVPDVSVYNTILHAVLRKQVFLLALALYNQMLKSNCRVDEAFALLRSFEKEDDFKLQLRGYSSLIDGLFRVRRYDEAYAWYRKMFEVNIKPDVVLYTVMIRGLSDAGKVKDAVKLMDEMNERGVAPDTYCYNAVIKGFCDAGLLNQARSLQLEILKRDSFPNTCTHTILICGMCRNGLVMEAEQIFNDMEKVGCLPSVVTFNALIDGLCKAGELEKANLLFYKMEIGRNPSLFLRLSQGANRVLDSASLQTMVEQYCESGFVLKAYKILMQLADSGNVPDLITYNILINGFCRAGNINGALKLFKELQVKGLSPDSVTYGTLVTGLLRIGREEDAFKIFNQMAENGCTPSQSVYKTLMTWSCRRSKVTLAFTLWLKYLRDISGREDEAIKVIEEHFEKGDFEKAVRGLLEMDFKLNDFNLGPYTIWLIGLCQAGLVVEGLKIFSILNECGVIVTPPSCVKLIHALCKRGKLNEAMDVFLYTLKNGFKLMPRVCNYLLRSLLLSKDGKHHAYDLLSRMESLGYDLDSHLYGYTKTLLSDPWNRMAMENASPG
ncbi:hypothetical protein LWI29_004950 [Acer saccharum]|uniref:Pentatricopeptide repeat-containing protein n=1 Tax=Acer saccharum TaxID=4024 RepID=A0AA39VJS5_ACESA|nr:hypothetical protein LWI29_004950 [Acer saccharum]